MSIMRANKQRLTITVDPHLVDAAQRAVESGEADSVSHWIGAAIEDKVERDAKLALLALAIADYEAEFGEITTDEITIQRRLDRTNATVVRGTAKST